MELLGADKLINHIKSSSSVVGTLNSSGNKIFDGFVSDLNQSGLNPSHSSPKDTVNPSSEDIQYITRLKIKKKQHEIKEDDNWFWRLYKKHTGPVLLTALTCKVLLGFAASHYVLPRLCPGALKKLDEAIFKKFENVMRKSTSYVAKSELEQKKVYEGCKKVVDYALLGSGVIGAAYMYATEQYDFYFEKMVKGIQKEVDEIKHIKKNIEKTVKGVNDNETDSKPGQSREESQTD